jgi:hypothetical protein
MITSLVLLALTTACSGSGDSSGSRQLGGVSLSPLIVADRVSVVDAQDESSKPAAKTTAPISIKALLLGKLWSELPETSDYRMDVSTVYVNELSTKAFEEINGILCSVKQTRYDAMINQGPYNALVDNNLCWNDASNSTDQSSGSATPNYQIWTVNSRRASETAPHFVDIWFDESYEDYGNLIEQSVKAQIIITEGVDTAPPYGKFQLNYIVTDLQPPYAERSRGLLKSMPNPKTGEALLQFAEENPDFSRIKKSTLEKNPDGTGGGTVLSIENIPPEATRFDIAFNTTHFLRQNYDADPLFPNLPGSQVCLDRINFDESAWRYGLYDQSGKRVNVNSGFTIKKGSEYGWVGYWGFWMPNNPDGTPGTVANGETVYEHDFSTNTDTPYTVFQRGGKLKKYTKKPLTLGEIKFIPLNWWGGQNCSVVWDGADFTVTAEQDASGNWGPRVSCPAKIDMANLPSSELNFWSQSLGGQVRVPLSAVTTCSYNPTNGATNCSGFDALAPGAKASTDVIYYVENIVYPGEAVPLTLSCYENCPQTAGPSGIDPTVSPLPYHDTWDDVNSTSIRTDYTFTSDPTAPNSMVLMEGSNPVVLASATADPNYQWGVGTGALISSATPTTLLACDWDNTKICGGKAWYLDEFYSWETGPNPWNQFSGLTDGTGSFVRFDPPLRVTYTHAQPDSTKLDYKYNGAVFNLEYNGFGNLSGIPGACVDMNTGEVMQTCDNTTRWVPEFTIPDVQPAGAPNPGNLTEVTGPDSVQYIVKALEKEQRMQLLDVTTDCAPNGLAEATPYPLPSMTLWKMPTNGPDPNITSDPKVIGGVVQ